jgi:hypothetical protein
LTNKRGNRFVGSMNAALLMRHVVIAKVATRGGLRH